MCLDSLTENTKELTASTLGLDVSINGISTEMAVGVTHGWSMLGKSYALQVRTRSSKDLVFNPSHEGFKPKCSMR